ncbi:hypothetical protein BCR41DRAFT_39089 [Lobosporangium transversale]|uniref:Uncharacterized protein n=1 Tax=Lobosporangium transversale TaxID=64571 RepID=A0A1Y2GSP9_9FUNG|nr:hypothetical protein BCR41DRAFT_39089 [Lobosporangium transversale]ORZ19132.1 hypothetical protein BCR41DRAFT_39089 [Lobosporangium transversale]|eukprot:XP_021882300.1 hypothetical protein BCR41DRAFT_39089 [Lobosporangium transversale]
MYQSHSIWHCSQRNDVFTSGATNDSSWDSSPGLQPPGVIQAIPVNRGIQQHNRFNNPQYVTLQALQQGADSPSALVRIKKEEDVIEPKIEVKEEGARLYADMATQTGANTASQPETFSGAMMMMVMPSTLDQTKRMSKARVPLDAEALLESAPNAPDMPLLGIDIKEAVSAKGAASKEVEETSQSGEQQSIQEAVGSEDRGPGLSKFGSYVQKARARQAAAAAAAASASATNSTLDSAATIESLDPMEAMTRQFEQTRLSGSDDNHSSHNAPATDLDNEDEERRLRAAKARTLCAQDPVRRQHAKVLWNLIKSFNFLMAHPEKVAQYRAALSKGSSSGVYRKTNAQSLESGRSSTPHRGDASSTAGSTSIAPHRPSPLHQEYKLDFDYNRLRSALLDEASSYHPSPPPVASQAKHTKDTGSETETYEQSIDSPVLYPTSDLHHSSVPFELSEEERRFIEEDNARTAAAKAAASNEAETESDSEYCIV